MPNFLEMLRLKNIFNPPIYGNDLPEQGGISGSLGQQPDFSSIFGPKKSPFGNISFGDTNISAPTPAPAPVPESLSPADRIAQAMGDLYQPKHGAADRYEQILGQYPNEAGYKPSMLRRIGAALTAFGPGGYKGGMEFLYRPWNERIEDWKNQVVPAERAADNERADNTQQRTFAYQVVSQQLRAEADDARERNNATKAQIAQQRADVYEFKARNPNLKFDFSGPSVMVANPITGEVHDTKIPTGSLSDADKMALSQEQAIARIKEGGAQQRETEETRQTNRIELQGIEQAGREKLKGIPTPGSTNKPEMPTQTRVRYFNNAQQLANSDPELGKFIKLGQSGEFTITPPGGTNFFGIQQGPTAEQYKRITDAIYGTSVAPQSSHGAPPPPGRGTTKTAVPSLPAGTVIPKGRVAIAKDGKIVGTISASQLQQALDEGYQEVK